MLLIATELTTAGEEGGGKISSEYQHKISTAVTLLNRNISRERERKTTSVQMQRSSFRNYRSDERLVLAAQTNTNQKPAYFSANPLKDQFSAQCSGPRFCCCSTYQTFIDSGSVSKVTIISTFLFYQFQVHTVSSVAQQLPNRHTV